MLKRHNPKSLRPIPREFAGIYTHAVERPAVGRVLTLSGQIGTSPADATPEGFADQCHIAMDNIEALLRHSYMSTSNLVKLTYYLTQVDDLRELSTIRQQRWASEEPPAVTTLVVSALASPELLVEIEAVAFAATPTVDRHGNPFLANW